MLFWSWLFKQWLNLFIVNCVCRAARSGQVKNKTYLKTSVQKVPVKSAGSQWGLWITGILVLEEIILVKFLYVIFQCNEYQKWNDMYSELRCFGGNLTLRFLWNIRSSTRFCSILHVASKTTGGILEVKHLPWWLAKIYLWSFLHFYVLLTWKSILHRLIISFFCQLNVCLVIWSDKEVEGD